MSKRRAVVICPGRGSYGREELGYLQRYGAAVSDQISDLDSWRAAMSLPTITDLDAAEKYQPRLHTPGEHASSLIYACALADFHQINRESYEIVAITGNSMGWYLALALAQSLSSRGAYDVIQTMGAMMQGGLVGGQVLYPVSDENWLPSPQRRQHVSDVMKKINESQLGQVFPSIFLGGYLVLGGDEAGVKALLKMLDPVEERYPFRLINHAAFHTPLLTEISAKAQIALRRDLFSSPAHPLIDGRGHIWQPYASDTAQLHSYTFGHQVVAAYDYTRAVTVALKEFAPDCLILLGPGSSLGGATAQICIQERWYGISNRQEFSTLQKEQPFLLAMGRPEQRCMVTD